MHIFTVSCVEPTISTTLIFIVVSFFYVVVHARQVFESQGLVAFSSVASCSSVLLLR